MTARDKSVIALVYRTVAFCFGVLGLVLICEFKTSGFMNCGPFVFYTIQTNIISTVVFGLSSAYTAYCLIAKKVKRAVLCIGASIQLATVLYIFVTFFVYWVVLYPSAPGGGGKRAIDVFANVLVHGVVPILALLDWILFMPHGRIKPISAAFWLSYPILYYVFTIVRAHVGDYLYVANGVKLMYPYFFIDVGFWDKTLAGKFPSEVVIAAIVILMLLLFYGLSRLCIFVDGKMGGSKSKKR